MRTSHASAVLTADERRVLGLLNEQLSAAFRGRYTELTQKIRQRTITEAEHEEIKGLAAHEEAWNVTRL